MDDQPGAQARASDAPGTLAKFHLGLAADGTSCAMVFVDEHQRGGEPCWSGTMSGTMEATNSRPSIRSVAP